MNSNTLLLRQIHPNWLRQGKATSQAFRPTSKDEGRLSVHDGDQVTPFKAWERHTKMSGLRSEGVMSVTVGEAHHEQLTVSADPQPNAPEHALIDFTALSTKDRKAASEILAQQANDRGWQYRP